jgi:hypothetical protein
MISVNVVVTVPGVLKCTYEGVTFHRALFILNDLFGEYGDTVQYMVFNGETGEVIESVDLNRVCQSVYRVSDMIELVPYLGRYEKVTTLDGYVLWDRT